MADHFNNGDTPHLQDQPVDTSSSAGSSPVVIPPPPLVNETDLTDNLILDEYGGPEGFATIIARRGPSLIAGDEKNKTSHDLGDTILRHHIDIDGGKTLSRNDSHGLPLPLSSVTVTAAMEHNQQRPPKSYTTVNDAVPTPIIPPSIAQRSSAATRFASSSTEHNPGRSGINVADNDFVQISINGSRTGLAPALPVNGADPQELTDQDVIKAVLREAATLSGGQPRAEVKDATRQRQPTDDEYPGNIRFPPLGSIRVTRPHYPGLYTPPTVSAVSSDTSGGTEDPHKSAESLETLQGENGGDKDGKNPAGDGKATRASPSSGGSGGSDIPDPVPFSASSGYWAAFFFDVIVRIADVVLSLIYLATYSTACNSLVSGFASGLVAARIGAQTVGSALGIGLALLLWDVWLAWCIHARGFTWTQSFAHTYGRRGRDMHSAVFNAVKGRALLGVVFRDTTTLAILTANLGPRDATVPVILKLSISAWLAAKDSATLATVFYAGCCFRRRVAADRTYYKKWPFRAVHAFILIVTLLWSLFVPFGLLMFKPDVLIRNVYLTRASTPPTIDLSIVCIPDFNSRSTPSSVSCNPTLCGSSSQPSTTGTIPNWFGWSPVHGSTIRFANVRVCANRTVPATPAPLPRDSPYNGLAWTFPLPNGRAATYFGDVPCLAPVIDMPGLIPQALAVTNITQAQLLAAGLLGGPQRAPAAAWAQSLSPQSAQATLALNRGRSMYRAGQTGPEADLDAYSRVYRGDVSSTTFLSLGVTANHYLRSDRVPRHARLVCPREWVFPVFDPMAGERYLLAVRIVHEEQVVGPLSCSFNGHGEPPVRSASAAQSGVAGQEQAAVWVRAGGGQL